jgi:uncharacterized caspase-like protein
MAIEDWALVVGINCYPAIGNLQGAEADAQEFYDWVTNPTLGGVDPRNGKARLLLSTPPASGKAKDAQPARYQIEEFFHDVDDAANANNLNGDGLVAGKRLYMYFSGHGFAPSFDRSAVLMANTTPTALDNLACRLWADRLFQGGWFKEVLLFQDACRNRMGAGTLMPSFLGQRDAPGQARFYALAAQDGKVALEKKDGAGRVRGVFTLTLMEALNGHARDPMSGEITSRTLGAYLQDNMRAKYTSAEQQNDDIAQMPEVYAPNPFVIVRAPPAGGAVRKFRVQVSLSADGLAAQMKDWTLTTIAENNGAKNWNLTLPIGIYKLSVAGGAERVFEVTGALKADGSEDVVNVAI